MITGPRAAGKTTTAQRLAATVVRLDDPRVGSAFLTDPDDALLSLAEPVLLDEWQGAPAVLGAIKRAVDADWRPNRFLLTGSARDRIDTANWPGTGRVVEVRMYGLSVAEQRGNLGTTFLDRVHDGLPSTGAAEGLTLRDYLDLGLLGGFPQVVMTTDAGRRRALLEGYTRHLVHRDAPLVERRDPFRLSRFFSAWCIASGTPTNAATLNEHVGIRAETGNAYSSLLESLFVCDTFPAWYSTRLQRLSSAPKRFVVDSGLLAATLHLDAGALLSDGDVRGRFMETFVAAQLRAEVPFSQHRPTLFHLRQQGGRHEVDIIVEYADGSVAAIEIKAGSTPTAHDARHLLWLRDILGDQLVAALVLHTGPHRFRVADHVDAVPISELWAGG